MVVSLVHVVEHRGNGLEVGHELSVGYLEGILAAAVLGLPGDGVRRRLHRLLTLLAGAAAAPSSLHIRLLGDVLQNDLRCGLFRR
jgi:hypothetical protein